MTKATMASLVRAGSAALQRTMQSAGAGKARAWWRQLRLASKLSLIVASIGLVGLLLGGLMLDMTIRPSFDRLERDSVRSQVGRADALLESALSKITDDTKNYAVWDGSFNYVANHDHAFEAEALTPLSVVNAGIDAISYAQLDGHAIYSLVVDQSTQAEAPSLSRAFRELTTSPSILNLARTHTSFSTFVQFNGHIFVVGGAQVVKSDGSGTPRGYVLMARQLAPQTARAALQVDTTINLQAPSHVVSVRLPGHWQVSVPILGSDRHSIGSLNFQAPRTTSALGASTILSALVTITLIMAVALMGLAFLMRVVVVHRLRSIDDHMRDVARSGELLALPANSSLDEVGSLSRTFNAMLAQLKELSEQVEIQSYELGKSESAASAIHNVRNSLNPVTVILSQVIAEQAPVKSQNVFLAIDELSAGATDAERRERLAAFLTGVVNDIEQRDAARRASLLTAKTSLSEALDILNLQNETAHARITLEQFDILEILQKNALLARFAPWGEIEVVLPKQGMLVRSNRLLMSQIVGNLFTNAVEAIVAGGRHQGRIDVSLSKISAADDDMITLTITDDGRGFSSDSAPKLFERGHSSKKGRAGGLGLHWCANTMTALGGTLSIESEGPGKGARASVVLRRQIRTATASDALDSRETLAA
ncbi:MAG: CHASE4 domain-containing protein [Vitreimonas sp.]